MKNLLTTKSRLAHYALIILVAALALLPANGSLPLIDRDEPRFTQATREMAQKHEWFVPYFNGQYRFDKPVMTYWLMRISFVVFGDNEFAARFASVLCSLAVALLIYEFTRKRATVRAALLAAGGWLTTFQVLLHGRLAVADMPMVLAVAVSHYAMYELLFAENTGRKKWFWILYISLAFGFLSKGPIALLCPAFTLVLFRFALWRKPLPWGNLKIISGSLMALFIVALWGIPALIKTGGLFWKVGMNEHVVQRGLESFNSRLFLPLYYIPTAFLSLFPWIGFVGLSWGFLRRNWNRDNAYLVAWILGPYIIFSLYATQLPHYVLPAFPAVLIVIGMTIDTCLKEKSLRSRFLWFAIGLGIILAGILFGFASSETFSEASLPLKHILLSLVGILLSLAGIALWTRREFYLGVGAAVIILAYCFSYLGANVRALSVGVQLKPLFQEMPANAERIFHGFEEPSIIYYSDAKWKIGEINEETSSKPGARMFLLLKREVRLEDYLATKLPKLIKKKDRSTEVLGDSTRALLQANGYRAVSVSGLNLARISWVETETWYRP